MENDEEWDFFSRIEGLESKTWRLDILELTTEDAIKLSREALLVGYAAVAMHSPKRARRFKDNVMTDLKKKDLNPDLLDGVEEDLSSLADDIEKVVK